MFPAMFQRGAAERRRVRVPISFWNNPMPTEQQQYFRRREAQERASADASADASARAIHLELARRYAKLGAAATERGPARA